MIDLAIVVLILLTLSAILDARFRSVPSVLLTATLFVALVSHFVDFDVGLISLAFGVMAGIFGLFLYELDFFGGIGDIKYITIIGIMITNVQMFFAFMLLTVLFGMAYKIVIYFQFKDEDLKIPFMPCLLAVYITLMIIGGVA